MGRGARIYQAVAPGLESSFPSIRSLTGPNNLPVQSTSFVGRDEDLTSLLSSLRKSRLVTLTGVGGTGKTRLALHAGAQVLDDYRDGVWLAELSAIAEGTLVSQSVADALDVTHESGASVSVSVVGHLADRGVLLILDNCEHVIDASADLCHLLMQKCPGVTLLATSREALGVPGEQSLPIRSLTVPGAGKAHGDLASIAESPAVQLFVDRARAVKPDFQITSANAAAVVQITRRLDGIPLAIEFAAARTAMLTPIQIAEMLDHRFRLLTGSSRTALPRQQTLEATLAWGYDLLSPEEASLFRDLGVFRGGWGLEAAQAIGASRGMQAWDVIDIMGRLIAKSLVTVEPRTDDTPRYRMLETVRHYAQLRLAEGDDESAAREAHLDYYEDLVGRARVGGYEKWEETVAAELPNVRAAIEWALDHQVRLDATLRMTHTVARYLNYHGNVREAADLLRDAVDRTADMGATPTRVRTMLLQAFTAAIVWDLAEEMACVDAARAEAVELKDDRLRLEVEQMVCLVSHRHGDAERVESAARSWMELARALGDMSSQSFARAHLGFAASWAGDLDAGRDHFDEALRNAREHGNPHSILESLTGLALIEVELDDLDSASRVAEEILQVIQEVTSAEARILGHLVAAFVYVRGDDMAAAMANLQAAMTSILGMADQTWHEAQAAVATGMWQWRSGRPELGLELVSAAIRICDSVGARPWPGLARYIDEMTEHLREELAPDTFADAWSRGQRHTRAEVRNLICSALGIDPSG